MRHVLVFFIFLQLCCLSVAVHAQQVNGHWYGVGILQDAKQNNSYMTEMILRQKGKLVWGELLYYFKDSLIKTPINGSYDKNSGKLVIKPIAIIYYKSPNARNSVDCYMSGFFRLVASKTESVLQGSLMSDEEHRYTVPDISYRLKKSNDTTELVMKDEPEIEPAKPQFIPAPRKTETTVEKTPKPTTIVKQPTSAPSLPVVAMVISQPITITTDNAKMVDAFNEREKTVSRIIDVNNNTLRLEFYDNGEIDNDSISVFFNKAMILPQSMLNLTPNKLNSQLDSSLAFNELSMVAINLGTIPPNTALLVLYDGNIRYEVFLSSDLNKSATLRLRKKRK